MAKKKARSSDYYKKLLEKVQSIDLGGGGFWKPSVGRSVVRILPPVGSMDFFFCEVGEHYIDGNRYTCPDISLEGEPCPICEVNQALWEAGEKDAASDYRVRRAFWMNVIVRGREDDGPRIFTPGITIFNSIAALIADPDYGDIADVEYGTDLTIDRTGEGLKTEYEVVARRHESLLSEDPDLVDEWLDNAADLAERIRGSVLPYDELAENSGVNVYFGNEGEDDDYEEDEEPEDEEPEDEEPEDEEPASERIKRRMSRRSGRRGGRRSGRR